MNDVTYFVLSGIVLLLCVWLIGVSARNRIIRVANTIENAYGRIDVLLKRRADLIPNVVEVVKGYAAHESSVFVGVAEARAGLLAARSPQDAHVADGALSLALGRLFAVAEAYPELKASVGFGKLQEQLSVTEDDLALARQAYNDAVLKFNDLVLTFPGNVLAGKLGGRKAMLEASASDRVVPSVKLA
jgi:LemA protein